jgi:ribosomal subunit interface protein
MNKPLQITFHGVEPSDAVEARIRAKVDELERFARHVVSCHVTVEQEARQHRKGTFYVVRIDVRVPNGEIVASRDPARDHAHEDVFVSIRDAFKAVVRQLEDYVRRQRGQVKHHEPPVQGRVSKLFRDDGYGFIELADGMDVYFHENSVVGAVFENLRVGDGVRLVVTDDESEKGPQANTVTPMHKQAPIAVNGRR